MFITMNNKFMISPFVCIRDKHHDNVLIHIETYTVFHIDFGNIFDVYTNLQ